VITDHWPTRPAGPTLPVGHLRRAATLFGCNRGADFSAGDIRQIRFVGLLLGPRLDCRHHNDWSLNPPLSCFRVLRLGYTGRTFGDKCLLHERCDRKATRAQYLNSIQSSNWQERPKSIFISLPIRGVPPLLIKPRSSGASFCLYLLRTKAAPRIDRVLDERRFIKWFRLLVLLFSLLRKALTGFTSVVAKSCA
jgi:hypothetical protein